MTALRADEPATGQPAARPRLSVVVPTFNEAANVNELLARLVRALPAELPAEVVFVDDSTDETPAVIAAADGRYPIPIRLRHRAEPVGGLGGAVVEGLRLARAPWVVVMDGDLQHPPAVVPELIAAGERSGADLVVASRYTDGGSRDGLAGGYRVLVSGASTLLVKLAFARALRGISDPMSGFFAVRRAALDLRDLRPLGYKILLELVVRCRPTRVEVPYRFDERFGGSSKSSLREGIRFLRHLVALRCGDTPARLLAFGAIGLSGVLPNLAALWLLTRLGLHYLPAAIAANQLGILWNLLLVDRLLFHGRRRLPLPSRLGGFVLISNLDLVARLPMLALLVERVRMDSLLGTAITLLAGFGLRFLLTDRVLYLPGPERGTAGRVPARLGPRFSDTAVEDR